MMRWGWRVGLVGMCLAAVASGCQSEREPNQRPLLGADPEVAVANPVPEPQPLDLVSDGLAGELAVHGKLIAARLDGEPALVLADEDDSSLRIFARKGLRLVRTLPLQCAARRVLLDEHGDLLAVSTACGQLQRLQLRGDTVRVVASLRMPAEPVDMVADGDYLFVVSDWGSAISKVERSTLELVASQPLDRSPQAVTRSEDGETLYVAHAVGNVLSQVDAASLGVTRETLGAVRHVSRSTKRLRPIHRHSHGGLEFDFRLDVDHPRRQRRMPRPTAVRMLATQGFAIASGAGKVFVPQVLASPKGGGTFATGYGISSDNFPPTIQDVAVFDSSQQLSNRGGKPFAIINGWKASDKNTCRLPRAAVYDDVRSSLLVACVGSSRVVEFDATARDPARTELAEWKVGRGPAALHLDAERRRLYVWSEYERTLSALQLTSTAPLRPLENSADGLAQRQAPTPPGRVLGTAYVPLSGDATAMANSLAELSGRELFHRSLDPAISKDGRACASCHPNGRDDGLSWRAPGVLGSRQTMMLAGRLRGTAPYGWQGEHATLEQHVRHTIVDQLDGTGLEKVELEQLVRFIGALPGPNRGSAETSADVERGRALFLDTGVGCTDCHADDGHVDGAQHELEAHVRRDTPSLRYVVGTAPFFHDGRYATLNDMLEHSQGTMGQDKPLDEAARADLVAYLRTL